MSVAVPVSSMKINWAVFSKGWSCRHCSRALATSGLSCSAACSVFFEADAVAAEEPPNRARTNCDVAPGQPLRNLLQRQIRLGCNQAKQPLLLIVQPGTIGFGSRRPFNTP